jgi:hypothetical protein
MLTFTMSTTNMNNPGGVSSDIHLKLGFLNWTKIIIDHRK